VDSIGTGVFHSPDVAIPGVTLTLTGKTSQGTSVSTTATTDGNGAFTFDNVLPGTYGVSGNGGSIILGAPNVGGLSVVGGQTVTQNIGFRGLIPGLISMRLFLASTTSSDLPFAAAGSGSGLANFRPNNTPLVISSIAPVSVAENSDPTTINLASHITDPDLTFKIDTTDGAINVRFLFNQAPKTVTNFLDYALSGAYNNSIFHRLVTQSSGGLSVLQGGGFTFDANTHTINTIQTNSPVPNEFSGTPNAQGTMAMALTGNDINSATDEFFFNYGDNSGALDPQKFTVFAQILGSADQSVLNSLSATTPKNENSQFGEIPLVNYTGTNFPTDATASNFIMVNDVTAVNDTNETLTYTVADNSNSSLVSAAIDPSNPTQLKLTYTPNQTGTATITVKATDRYGAFVTDKFTVSVNETKPTATVTLDKTSPLVSDTLTATATASDADKDPVTLTYVWQVNGTTVQTTSNTSSLTDTLKLTGIAKPGDSVTVTVTPHDPTQDGATATATATVAEPVVGTINFSPSDPSSSSTLTANLVGSHASSFTYDWTINGTDVQTDTIAVTSDTLNHALVSGDQITVKVTPSDGTNSGTSQSLSTTVNLPQAGGVTLSSTTPAATDTVKATVSSATDPNGDPITLTYQWQVNGTVVQTTSNTSSLTDSLDLATVSGVTVQSGNAIILTVTPSNGTLNGSPVTATAKVA
jgi:cyclophilin family peptidyl-prolyl cis-trans isomerase